MTSNDMTKPTTIEKMIAAIVTAPPRSHPTSGIHFSRAMIGEKRRNHPNMVKKMPDGRTILDAVVIFFC